MPEINVDQIEVPEIETKADGTLVATFDLPKAFAIPGELDRVLKHCHDEVAKHEFDPGHAAGRASIKSLAYQVARSKTAIDDTGSRLVERLRKTVQTVDRLRKIARDDLDALAAEVRRPALEWEAAESKRIAEQAEWIASLYSRYQFHEPSDVLEAELQRIRAIVIDGAWGEREEEANRIRRAEVARVDTMLEQARKREAEALELEELRAKQAAREEEDRARQRAEIAAEEQRWREEREAKIAAEAAEKERVAAALQLAEVERRNIRRVEAAAAAERQRQADEAAAAEAVKAKREKNLRLRASVKRNIVTALTRIIGDSAGAEGPVIAALIATELMDGKVPHCHVEI